jgi:hypothetical protein
MSSKVFLFIVIGLAALVVATSPPVLGAVLRVEATPTPGEIPPTSTPTATPTLDPFGDLPMATPLGGGGRAVARPPSTPSLGDLPPTYTPDSIRATPAPAAIRPVSGGPTVDIPSSAISSTPRREA